mgnify:FL=1
MNQSLSSAKVSNDSVIYAQSNQSQLISEQSENLLNMSDDKGLKEINRAEILDWWEAEQERVSDELESQLPELLERLDLEIDAMPIKKFIRKKQFCVERLEPQVKKFLENNHLKFRQDLENSFQKSKDDIGENVSENAYQEWSYGEMSIAGAAAVATIAPVGTLPFLTAGIMTAPFIGAPALIPGAAVVAGAGLVLVAAGPSFRGKAIEMLKDRFKKLMQRDATLRILGDPSDPTVSSLKGKLLNELRNVTMGRLDALK